ncbi:hypothetical protein IW150_003613, partial [Coemansia sp. RSA 2607]
PVPRLANEAPDLVRAYCVAGSVEIARTHLFGEGRRSSESAIGGMQTAQNVYIATQSGALHCVRATRKPFISITRVEARHGGGSTGSAVPATAAISQVGPMLYLGSHSSKRHRNTDTTELAPDFLFCGGECADNAIVRVADEGFWSNTALQHDGGSTVAPNSESTLVWSSRRTVSNPSPMADFILEPHQSYWAAGIGSNGVIHQAQFGHGVRFEETVCFGDTEATGSSRAVTHIWSFTVPSISGRDKTLCMVLQVAETYIPIIRDDEEGEWQLLSALQLLLTDKRLLYVGSGGFDSSGDHQVICISNKCVFLVVGATTSFTMSENIKRSIVYEASDSEVFTHGACVESLTNNNPCNGTHSWVVLATRKADASSSIRLVSLSDSNVKLAGEFEVDPSWAGAVSQIASVPTDCVATINLDAQCHVRELPIDVEPRRIIRDSETGMMLVAGVSRPIETTFTSVPTSLIKVIDVSSGEVHTEIKLEPQEIIHSLETWHIQGQKSYRYICIGTGQYGEPGIHQRKQIVPSPRAAGGRLVIYSLKALKRKPRTKSDKSGRKQRQQSDTGMSGYELRYVWESRRSAAVKALAHMGDSYLIVGEGTLCTVLQLDVVQRQLIECCEIELRFPVSSIDVRGNDIVVGSSRETVHLLQFVQSTGDDGENIRRLEMLHSARFGVSTADARYLSSDKIVGVDTSGYLYVVVVPGNTREFALDFIMGIHLGTECTNVKIGSLVHCIQKSKHVLPWDFKETVGEPSKDYLETLIREIPQLLH